MSVRDSYHVLTARRADIRGEIADIEAQPVICRNTHRLAVLVTQLAKVNREIRVHETNDKRRSIA